MSHPEPTEGSLPVGDSGKSLDTTVVTTGEGAVHREAVFLADPEKADYRANVSSPDQMHFYAARVEDHRLELIAAQMGELITIQKGMLKLLEAAFEDGVSGRELEEIDDGFN